MPSPPYCGLDLVPSLADLFIVGVLLLKPFGFRIASDTLSSGMCCGAGFRSVLAVSGYRLRARLDVSIPCSSPGQRGITPAFGYSAPHPSAEGTLMRIKLRDGLSPHLPDDTLIAGLIVQFIYNNQQVIVTFMRPSASSSSR